MGMNVNLEEANLYGKEWDRYVTLRYVTLCKLTVNDRRRHRRLALTLRAYFVVD